MRFTDNSEQLIFFDRPIETTLGPQKFSKVFESKFNLKENSNTIATENAGDSN